MKNPKEILKSFIPTPLKQFGAEWINRRNFQRKLETATPVHVYQMGKVGSTSIYRSLKHQYSGVVLQTHDFSQQHKNPKVERLYQWTIVEAKPLKVISLTREPIGRNVSAFFQNFKRDLGIPYADSHYSIEELKALFLAKNRHEVPLTWFDRNILTNFGIDVYAAPFPENGIATYSRNNIELLVMRLEIADSEKVSAIKKFLGLDEFELQNKNIGGEKDYSATYREFSSRVKFSSDYIEQMCRSKYFNHFYSKEVIAAARERWIEKQ